MDIILYGEQKPEELVSNLSEVMRLFKDRYNISLYREIRLSLSLLDDQGMEVELVDNETSKVYRIFEVHNQEQELSRARCTKPCLELVVDNTKSSDLF